MVNGVDTWRKEICKNQKVFHILNLRSLDKRLAFCGEEIFGYKEIYWDKGGINKAIRDNRQDLLKSYPWCKACADTEHFQMLLLKIMI